MNGIVKHTSGDTPRAFEAAYGAGLFVTRYHLEQAKKRQRRAKARSDAPKRARARRIATDAAIAAAGQIQDAEERKLELLKIEDRDAAGRLAAATARDERERVKRRMIHGFESASPVEVGGRMRDPLFEKGLRSDRLGRPGKMFVAGCRKGRFLRSAQEKGFICVQSGRKVLNLDFAYVEGNRKMVSLVRVDLDRLFMSFDELRTLLQELVDEGRLPCMPHLVVGDVAPILGDGGTISDMLVRPHLWFILPAAVNMSDKGRAGPKRLLDAVYRGLCHALLGLGADPDAAALLVRGKNPLSPWWQSECFNEESYPSLTEYAAGLQEGMRMSRERLSQLAAEKQSGLPRKRSNGIYNAAADEAFRLLRELHSKRNREYLAALKDRNGLMYPLLARLMPMDSILLLGDGLLQERRGAYVLDKVISYACSRWDPDKADAAAGYRRRDRLSHLCAEGATLAEKQAASGRAVAGERAQAARKAIMGAMYTVEKGGMPFTKAEVSRTSGLDRKTVSKHWLSCASQWGRRCLDKKGGIPPVDHRAATVEVAARKTSGNRLPVSGGYGKNAPVPTTVPVEGRKTVLTTSQPEAVRHMNPVGGGNAASSSVDVPLVVSAASPVPGTPGCGVALETHSLRPASNPSASAPKVVLPPLFTIRSEIRRKAEELRRADPAMPSAVSLP